MISKSLFIFRRDLRIEDNTALNAALEESKQVIPCFIFDPRQVEQHAYLSLHALQFLRRSLADLEEQLRIAGGTLAILYGRPEEVLSELIRNEAIEAVFFNRDYTPFSRNRDRAISTLCQSMGIQAKQYGDALLYEPESIAKDDGTPYTVYSAFAKKCVKVPSRAPRPLLGKNFGTLIKDTSFLAPDLVSKF